METQTIITAQGKEFAEHRHFLAALKDAKEDAIFEKVDFHVYKFGNSAFFSSQRIQTDSECQLMAVVSYTAPDPVEAMEKLVARTLEQMA